MKKLVSLLLCGVLAATDLMAQANPAFDQLREMVIRMAQFNKLCPQEKVYLHFDNTAYFQGDAIWFSAYLVNATTGVAAQSKVLYVELLSSTGVLLKQYKLKVENGRCHGSIPLVDLSTDEARGLRGVLSYPSGFYEVRAYTKTMLNFADAGVFSRVFPVYERPAQEGDYSKPVMNTYANDLNPTRPTTDKVKEVNAAFYPEGGNLVQGIRNRIAFKATGKNGKGIAVVGVVKGEQGEGEDLALLSTQHDGMGYFNFIPTKKRHSVILTYEGKEYTFKLPEAIPEGYTLQADNLNDETLLAEIHATAEMPKELLGVTLTCRGQVVYFDTLSIQNQVGVLSIPKSEMPTGVHQLTLFNPKGEVLVQRQLFINNGLDMAQVMVQTDASSYQPYAPVTLSVQTSQPDGTPLQTSVSLAVRDVKDLGTTYNDQAWVNLLLSSELKGFIDTPSFYFEKKDRQHVQALDLLMMTQGWTRYNWKQMAGVEPFYIQHYVEDGMVLDGWLLSRRKSEPIADATVGIKLYSKDRSQKQENTIVTDKDGHFGFQVEEFEGVWDMFLTAKHNGDPIDAHIKLDRASRPALRAFMPLDQYLPEHALVNNDKQTDASLLPDKLNQALPDSVYALQNVDIVGNRKYIDFMTFKAFDADEDTEYQLDCGRFTYKVSDYLKEKGYNLDDSYYDGVVDSSVNSREEFIAWSLDQCLLNSHRVLWYLHDEHRNLATTGYIPGFDMDMEDIKSIMVYDSPVDYMAMPIVRETLTSDQIMALSQSKKLVTGEVIPSGLYVIDVCMYPVGQKKTRVKGNRQTTFKGYSQVAEFYSPSYPDGPIKGDVDYRRTIYWNPDVTTDEAGKAMVMFYNNGYSKQFTISAEGVTADGKAIKQQ